MGSNIRRSQVPKAYLATVCYPVFICNHLPAMMVNIDCQCDRIWNLWDTDIGAYLGGGGYLKQEDPLLTMVAFVRGMGSWMKGDNELSTNSYCHLFPDCRCSGTLLFTTPSHQDELYIINCELGRVFSLLSCSHRVFCHDSGKSKLWTVLPGCTASF